MAWIKDLPKRLRGETWKVGVWVEGELKEIEVYPTDNIYKKIGELGLGRVEVRWEENGVEEEVDVDDMFNDIANANNSRGLVVHPLPATGEEDNEGWVVVDEGGEEGEEKEKVMEVGVRMLDGIERKIDVFPSDYIYEKVGELGLGRQVDVRWFEELVGKEVRFKDIPYLTEGNRGLSAIPRKSTINEVVTEILELNSHLNKRIFVESWRGTYSEDPSHVMGDVNWGYLGINVLPESIGDLTVDGNLELNDNILTTLPESFGSLTVGGNLYLNNNNLGSLPESFGSLKVGGSVFLNANPSLYVPVSRLQGLHILM